MVLCFRRLTPNDERGTLGGVRYILNTLVQMHQSLILHNEVDVENDLTAMLRTVVGNTPFPQERAELIEAFSCVRSFDDARAT